MSMTVGICTYNNGALLERTLSSLEAQIVSKEVLWDVLVVDNNSTDQTAAVVGAYIERGLIPRLRRVLEPRQGLAYARRRVVQETDADVIAFVDDDCLLDPQWVQSAVSFCAEHPKAGAIGGKVDLLWEATPSQFVQQLDGGLAKQDHGDLPLEMPKTGFTWLVGAGLVIKSEALLSSGWMEYAYLTDRNGTSLTAGGDTEIVLRIRQAGYELWYNPAMQMQHIIPAKRMSSAYLRRLYHGLGRSSPKLEMLAHNHPTTLSSRASVFRNALQDLMILPARLMLRDLYRHRGFRRSTGVLIFGTLGRFEAAIDLLFNGMNPVMTSDAVS